MKSSGILLVALIATMFVVTGCVTQSEFDEYKAQQAEHHNQVDQKIQSGQDFNAALSCESRFDAYQDMVGSDEPIPTRRDEPIATRRETCQQDFQSIFGPHLAACKPHFTACLTVNPTPDCRACLTDCLETGAWDNAACPPPPP